MGRFRPHRTAPKETKSESAYNASVKAQAALKNEAGAMPMLLALDWISCATLVMLMVKVELPVYPSCGLAWGRSSSWCASLRPADLPSRHHRLPDLPA